MPVNVLLKLTGMPSQVSGALSFTKSMIFEEYAGSLGTGAALIKAGRRSGYAVLPYKGPNGTWQRPIVLECQGGTVKLQRQGRTLATGKVVLGKAAADEARCIGLDIHMDGPPPAAAECCAQAAPPAVTGLQALNIGYPRWARLCCTSTLCKEVLRHHHEELG